MNVPAVAVGQVWADNDRRSAGRKVRIIHVTESHAVVGPADPKARGRATRIRLDRFRPTTTGYRLLTNADGTPA
ncbi:DUF6354 family protein [Micromonospora sp. NPDC004704]